MRLNRSIRHRGKRRRKHIMDLDITSLLDILVIMLVFLLKSYNSSGLVLNVPKGIILPKSESQQVNTSGVMVQVSKDTLWVDDKEIMSFAEKNKSAYLDDGDRRIFPLYNELIEKKKMIKRIEQSAPNAQKFSGMINFILDRSLKYDRVKQLLYTAAEAGFKRYKFVVLGEEN